MTDDARSMPVNNLLLHTAAKSPVTLYAFLRHRVGGYSLRRDRDPEAPQTRETHAKSGNCRG